tara:strand:+ start:887 stop:1204 length:318 start_codon:yes stop_codon:yes gene_type:complete
LDVQLLPSEELKIVPLFPTAINLFNPYATPNKFSVTPEFLVDQVKPSSEVKIVPLIPTPTNFTSFELLNSNEPELVVEEDVDDETVNEPLKEAEAVPAVLLAVSV